MAPRARIVLACAEPGTPNGSVAKALGVSRPTVATWRRRFAERGPDGLRDESRPGAPRTITDADVERVVTTTREARPPNATHRSTRSLARATGVSPTAVTRIWRAFALRPHRSETFKLWMRRMNGHKAMVADYLQADRSLFVNGDFLLHLDADITGNDKGRHWYVDFLSASFKERIVFLCEVTFSQDLSKLMRRMKEWSRNWGLIVCAIHRDTGVPSEWEVRPWVFIPEDRISLFVSRLRIFQHPQKLLQLKWLFLGGIGIGIELVRATSPTSFRKLCDKLLWQPALANGYVLCLGGCGSVQAVLHLMATDFPQAVRAGDRHPSLCGSHPDPHRFRFHVPRNRLRL